MFVPDSKCLSSREELLVSYRRDFLSVGCESSALLHRKLTSDETKKAKNGAEGSHPTHSSSHLCTRYTRVHGGTSARIRATRSTRALGV